MKKQLKEKQLKKRMATVKKGTVLAATALILGNSPIAFVTAFADNQMDLGVQPVAQQENESVKVNPVIDQSIYGNLLKNPTLQISNNRVTDWTTFIQNSSNTIATSQLKNVIFKASGDKYTLGGQTNYVKQSANLITLGGGNTQTGILSAPITAIKGRSYSSSIYIEQRLGDNWLMMRSGENVVVKGNNGWDNVSGLIEKTYKPQRDNEQLSIEFGTNLGNTYMIVSRNSIVLKMKYSEQWKHIDALFTSLDHTELASGVNRDAISKVKAMVNSIANNQDANEMNAALIKADTLFEKKVADEVDSLLNNGQLAPGTSQDDINKLQDLINQLPDGEKKQELQDKLNQAQELLTNEQNAQAAVDNLFNNGQLKPTVSQADIDQAQELVNKLPDGEKKQELQSQLDKAKEQFKQFKEVQTAVDNLFTDGQLKPTVSQTDIDQVQQLVNQLPDGEKKQELQVQLDKAKELFAQQQNALKEAQAAVDKLFGNNGQLAQGVTTEMIQEAQSLVDKVADESKKQELQNKLDKAQKLYHQKLLAEVTVMVNGWFTDAGHTALKDGVTTEDIDKALELLGQLPESNEKDKLAQSVSIAQTLLKNQLVNAEARKAVDSLFTDKTHTKLAENTTKEDIDNVKALVSKLEDVSVRSELTKLINKAYDLLENKSFTITHVDTYKEGETKYVSGTYTGNSAAYMRLIVNGKKETLTPLKASENGTFQYYRAGLKATDKVVVAFYNANYEELGQKEVTITPGEPTKIASVYPYVEGKDNWITGKYEGVAPAYIRVTVNGEKKPLVSFKATTDKTFKYYLPGLKGTDKVEVSLFNEAYQEVASQSMQVIGVEKVEITSIDSYKPGVSSWITGTVSGTSAKYMQLVVNGQKQGLVSSGDLANGTFSYYKAGLKQTDKAEIILYDKNYQEVARKEVPLEGNEPAKITSVDSYEVGKSEWITGKITGENAAYIRVVVNGEKKALLTFKNTDGTFKYYMAGLKATDNVEVEIFDNEYKKLDQKAVSFK